MADSDTVDEAGRLSPDAPPRSQPYELKGSGALDWGMQGWLARIFRPSANRTVMLAIDHGYFQGPTNGLERVDLSIVPLLRPADALMATRSTGAVHHPACRPDSGVCAGQRRPEHPARTADQQIAVDVEDAARTNASAVAVQVFIGGDFESRSVHDMTKLVDESQRYGIPVHTAGRRAPSACWRRPSRATSASTVSG
jgi:3-hydroxy-5-phosphonooxypentane-2,4-dione thiolase